MPHKTSHVLHRPKLNLPVFSLRKPVHRLKQFAHDYNLPLVMTALFILVAGGAVFLRLSQQASLADLLTGVADSGKEYGTLLSKDKRDELKKNTNNDQTSTTSPTGTPSSFAIKPSTSANSGTATTPTQSGGPSSAPVFGASIASFEQSAVILECTTPKPKAQTCSKRYTFNAGIRTLNGPGAVSYGWRSNLSSATADSGFSAGSGESVTPLQRTVTLACNPASSFNMQIVILSPTLTQSAVLSINHNCNDI